MPRFGSLGSHCRLGVNDPESPEGGVTEAYDTGIIITGDLEPRENGPPLEKLVQRFSM